MACKTKSVPVEMRQTGMEGALPFLTIHLPTERLFPRPFYPTIVLESQKYTIGAKFSTTKDVDLSAIAPLSLAASGIITIGLTLLPTIPTRRGRARFKVQPLMRVSGMYPHNRPCSQESRAGKVSDRNLSF
jgi:hypothetical protein